MTESLVSRVQVEEDAAIEHLKKLKDMSPIPETGPLGFLYGYNSIEGETIILRGKKSLQLLYMDHAHVIESLEIERMSMHLEMDTSICSISMITPYPEGLVVMPLSINKAIRSTIESLKQITSTGRINFNFIMLGEGNMVKAFHHSFTIPKARITELKTLLK